ncbi:MAG TPA: hypothetical protein VFJ98_01655 [Mycobacteriales bacterium]|nr:hypothetical protein [Mycobacteriales bacterium]
MWILLIVLLAVIVFVAVLAGGWFSGPARPTVVRRVIRRPVRTVVEEPVVRRRTVYEDDTL